MASTGHAFDQDVRGLDVEVEDARFMGAVEGLGRHREDLGDVAEIVLRQGRPDRSGVRRLGTGPTEGVGEDAPSERTFNRRTLRRQVASVVARPRISSQDVALPHRPHPMAIG